MDIFTQLTRGDRKWDKITTCSASSCLLITNSVLIKNTKRVFLFPLLILSVLYLFSTPLDLSVHVDYVCFTHVLGVYMSIECLRVMSSRKQMLRSLPFYLSSVSVSTTGETKQ